jgi:hypothetical protein
MAATAISPASAQDGWRRQYQVGQRVSFTISGRPADAQTCTVVENGEGSVMRVRCDKFKTWSAGTYIVYDAENIRRLGAGGIGRPAPRASQATGRAAPRTAAPAGTGGTLKLGEYACYGSGGRIMIGLGFKVTAPGRYTDLDGKNAGSFSISGGKVRFAGGHMAGQVGTMVGGNDFRIGLQARCEPY